MAIQRYFETTQSRLRRIFDGRLLDDMSADAIKRYFSTFYPMGIGFDAIDIIVGCLRFIHDDLDIKEYGTVTPTRRKLKFDEDTAIFTIYNIKPEDDESTPLILKFQNYRSSQYPSISVDYKSDHIHNLIGNKYMPRYWQTSAADMISDIIGGALFVGYCDNNYKGGKG